MRLLLKIILGWLLLISVCAMQPTAWAKESPQPAVRIRGTVWFVSSMNLYGIMSEDNKKYHPIKKLPNEWLKDGLEVVVEGKIRDDLVGAKMWGQPLEVTKITQADKYISWEDKEAVRLFLIRMEAFNSKDLTKLQDIDVVARKLAPADFKAWIFDTTDYTVHYIGTNFAQADTIYGICLYSRKHSSNMALSGDINYALVTFALNKLGDGWKFTDVASYVPEPGEDMNQLIDLFMAKAKNKYGTTNLAEWKAN